MKPQLELQPEALSATEQLKKLNELAPSDDWLENMNRNYLKVHLCAQIVNESSADQKKLDEFFTTRPAPLAMHLL